ncbi:MAG: TIGR03643 family protein [Bacteroidota bacterium]
MRHNLREIDRIIEMAWEDRTPFEAIFSQFNINEKELISIMRNNLKQSSFKLWRKRVSGRKTKYSKLRENSIDRFKSKMQKNISNNKISKR